MERFTLKIRDFNPTSKTTTSAIKRKYLAVTSPKISERTAKIMKEYHKADFERWQEIHGKYTFNG